MNFKTTILLIVTLSVVGILLIATRDQGEKPQPSPAEGTLLALEGKDVTRISIVSDDRKLTFEKAGEDWKMTEPVASAVEKYEIDSLLTSLTTLKSKGPTDKNDANLKTTGLDKPRYRVELTSAGKSSTVSVGSRAAVGASVYVMASGANSIESVDASLLDKLEKDAGTYRKAQLCSIPPAEMKQVDIVRADGKLSLRKSGENWMVVSPTTLPADGSAVSEVLFAINGMRATEFVSDTAADATMFQVGDNARTTVFVSKEAPSTQPAATQPAGITIALGRFDSVAKKDMYARVVGTDAIVKVSATPLSHLNKKPLELRDKKILNVDSDQVSRISIRTERPATTQPVLQTAVDKTITIDRRKQAVAQGPTISTTGPATTQAATQPAPEPSKWIVDSKDADDSVVSNLLSELRPLTVTKYVESIPLVLAAPKATYTIAVRTESAGGVTTTDSKIVLLDYGQGETVYGMANDLIFELPKSFISKIDINFTKQPAK